MTLFQSVFLGIVQGLTEFLPVSSSGHLAVLQRVFQRFGEDMPDPSSPELIAFDLVVHLGTLVSIFAVFGREGGGFIGNLLKGERSAWRFALLGALATVVTVAIAFPCKDFIEAQFNRPAVVAVGWIITGVLLLLACRVRSTDRDISRFAVWMAVVIGAMQALAVMPGVSRSGATIAAALMLGLQRRLSAQFSFFIAIPAIVGAAVLKLKDLQDHAVHPDWPVLAIGFLTAAVVGYLGLAFLLVQVRKLKLQMFSYYCWTIAAITLVAVAAGWI